MCVKLHIYVFIMGTVTCGSEFWNEDWTFGERKVPYHSIIQIFTLLAIVGKVTPGLMDSQQWRLFNHSVPFGRSQHGQFQKALGKTKRLIVQNTGAIDWGNVLHVKSRWRCELPHRTKFPMSLQLHTKLSPEYRLSDWLTDWPLCNLLHVVPTAKLSLNQNMLYLINIKVTSQWHTKSYRLGNRT
jgi:hypothetical protein